MTTEIASEHGETTCARILCVGDDVRELLGIQGQLDSEFVCVLVACSTDADAVLATEPPFDVLISDQRMAGTGGALMLARLLPHSPDAERLILARRADRAAVAMAATDGRVMRLLIAPCEPSVLREAVSDALLRHRARHMRATTVPRVTPISSHPCCVYLPPTTAKRE